MAKIILLSGSPNSKGNTFQVLDVAAKVLEENGVESEIVSLAGMELIDSMNKGKEEDGFDAIIDKIKDADGFIVGGPVYWGTVRSEVMVALQRIALASLQQGNFLSRKVGGPIVVGRRGGLTSSLQEMMMFYLSTDMIIPGSTYWNMVIGQKPGEALDDEEGIRTIKRFAENVAYLLNQLKK